MNLSIPQRAPSPYQHPLPGTAGQQLAPQARRSSTQYVPSPRRFTPNLSNMKQRKQYWMNYQNQNQKFGNEIFLKGFDIRKESHSFLFTMKQLTQIPFKDISSDQPPLRDARYYLEYYITLFNKAINNTGNFYGRTYRSNPISLQEKNGFWETTQDDFVYFHTSFTDKSSLAVVEFALVKEHKNKKEYGCPGFSLCNIFEFKGQSTVDVTKGSPRTIGQLVFLAEPQRGAVTKFTYELRDFPSFDLLKQFIPQNCFCGSSDLVPGIQNNTLPNPKNQQGAYVAIKLDQLPRQTVYIHNIQMETSSALENRFETFLKNLNQERQGKIGHLTPINTNVFISERRLLVSVHNTWKTITDDSYVNMLAPDKMGISHSGGSLTIKNFIDHPLVSLLFKLEYKAVLPAERTSETVYFTIGWQCHLPQFTKLGDLMEEKFEDEFILGPGKTPSGDLLWAPNVSEMSFFQVKLRAVVSSSPHAPQPSFQDRLSQGSNKQMSIEPYQHSSTMQPGGLGGRDMFDLQGNKQVPQIQPPFGQQPPLGQQPPPYGQQLTTITSQQSWGQQQTGGPGGQYQTVPQVDPRIQQQNEMKVRQLQEQLYAAERQARELQQKQEQMEMQKLRDQRNQTMNPDYNYRGGYSGYQPPRDSQLDEQMRLQELQKHQLESQVQSLQTQLKSFVNSVQDASSTITNPYQQQYYNEINRQLTQPLPRDSAQQIAMIANVFYNMLNMIGEQEKDQKILGLSENLKKMIQQQRFDDLLAPKAPYVGMGAINLLKTTDLPIKDQVNFIKMGYGDILQHPSAQITSSSIVKDRLNLEVEKQDPLKASAINIKFICFKTPWQGLEKIPSKFFFQLKFFTFPTIITDKVMIKPIQPGQPLRSGESYYLTKELQSYGQSLSQTAMRDTLSDPNLISLSFEIDSSISKIKDEHVKLAEYLRERFLTVDIFDGESLFLYGTCKIPLFEILRQGRSFVVRAKECEMCDPHTGDFKGAIQVIIGNQGRVNSIMEDQSHKMKELSINSPQKGRTQPSQATNEKNKMKKIIKSRPMDLTKVQQTNNPLNVTNPSQYGTSSNYGAHDFRKSIISQVNQQDVQYAAVANADLRKKLRVDRVKKMVMGETSSALSVEDPTQPDWAKFKSLKEIELIRETKKEQVINSVISEYITDQFQLSVISGQLEFLTVKLYNPYNQNEVFTIKIQDEDEPLLQTKELQIVTDQVEWRHWCSIGKCRKPPSWDCVTQTGEIILKPNDEVEVLFKYFTLREADLSPKTPPTSETVKKRNIKIIFFQSQGTAHQTIDVTVVPSSSPIDHIFRYYEPENSHVTLKIPPFVQLNYPGLTALVSRPNSVVDIARESSIISIEAKTEQAPMITEMTLYLYGDQYKEQLLATVKIEIYALIAIYSKIKAGIQRVQTLSLPAELSRTVAIFSSDPRNVYRSKKDDQKIRLIPQSINYIQVCAKIFSQTQQKVRVHCVDCQSGELVYSWLMILESESPKVTQEESFISKVNTMSVQRLQFTNKLNLRAVFEFSSSRPDLMRPKEEALMFEPKEFKPVALEFLPQPKFGATDVYLYASDQDQNVCECILIKIAYIP